MKKDDEKRLAELRGEQIRLQAQCYLMKASLEANERQLGLITAAIGEHVAEGQPPVPPLDKGEKEPPDA